MYVYIYIYIYICMYIIFGVLRSMFVVRIESEFLKGSKSSTISVV